MIRISRATPIALFILAYFTLGFCSDQASAHGGAYRGPRWKKPVTVPPPPPIPSGVDRSEVRPTPPPPEDPPEEPKSPSGDLPSKPTPPAPAPAPVPVTPPAGPIASPDPLPEAPADPATPVPGQTPGRKPSSASPTHWQHWWTLNRERILDLRGLVSERLGPRTTLSSDRPHFLGKGDAGNIEHEGDAARNEIVLALLEAADDDNADIATGAIIALGKAADPRAIPVLLRLAEAPRADRTVTESAVLALGMLGIPSPEIRGYLAEVAADRSRRSRTRSFAAIGLGFLGDVGAVPALLTRWHAPRRSVEVPACAILGLGLLGDDFVVPDLTDALAGPPARREKDDILRAHAAAALGMARAREGIPALVRALRDRDADVRRQAVLSLGAIATAEDRHVVKALGATLRADPDDHARAFAAVSLGEIRSPLAADAILYAYKKDNSHVEPYAALGLGLLARASGRDTGAPVVAEKILPVLRRDLVERRSTSIRGALAIALGIAADKGAVKPLRAILADSRDADLRGPIAVALGLIGAKEARGELLELLEDHASPDLQREVALALQLLGGREAVSVLAKILRTSRSEYTRGSAAIALGRMADPRTALTLKNLLADPELPPTTRAFAAVALGLVLDRHEVPILSRIGEHYNYRARTWAVTELLTLL